MNVLVNGKKLFRIPKEVKIINGNFYCACGLKLNYRTQSENLFDEFEKELPFSLWPIPGDHRRLEEAVKGKRHNIVWIFKKSIIQTYPQVTESQLYDCLKFASENLFKDPFTEKELKTESKINSNDRTSKAIKMSVTEFLNEKGKTPLESTKAIRRDSRIHKQVYNILEWNDCIGATVPTLKIAEYVKKKANGNFIFSERGFYNKEF